MALRYEISGCPLCASTDARTVADGDEVRAELEDLWTFHTRRLRGETPATQLHDRVAFSQSPPLRVAECRACGLLYRNPREKADALVELYGAEQADAAALASLFRNQLPSARAQAGRLTALAGGPGRGLEVGSYVGAFLHAAAERGWSFDGVDVNEDANRSARDRGFTIVSGTVEDVATGGYDAVAFWNCLDQLPDPAGAVRRARVLLRSRGLLALRVPHGAFYAAWRPRLTSTLRPLALRLLAHNNLLGFPYRHGFTIRSLTTMLDAAGFEIVRTRGDTLVPIADRWTRPWARVEERALKSALRPLPARLAPWLEVYARAT